MWFLLFTSKSITHIGTEGNRIEFEHWCVWVCLNDIHLPIRFQLVHVILNTFDSSPLSLSLSISLDAPPTMSNKLSWHIKWCVWSFIEIVFSEKFTNDRREDMKICIIVRCVAYEMKAFNFFAFRNVCVCVSRTFWEKQMASNRVRQP